MTPTPPHTHLLLVGDEFGPGRLLEGARQTRDGVVVGATLGWVLGGVGVGGQGSGVVGVVEVGGVRGCGGCGELGLSELEGG